MTLPTTTTTTTTTLFFMALASVWCVTFSAVSPVVPARQQAAPTSRPTHSEASNLLPASRLTAPRPSTPEHPPRKAFSRGQRDVSRGVPITFPDPDSEPAAPGLVNPALGDTAANTRAGLTRAAANPSGEHSGRSASSAGGGDGARGEAAASGGWVFPDENRASSAPSGSGNCLSNNLTMEYNGTTWTLLTRSECGSKEWVVLGEECRPSCQLRPCSSGQFQYKGKCVDPTDPSVCGEGQILYVHQTGKTYCDCEQNYFYDPRWGTCSARGEKGFCVFGHVMDLSESGDVICVPNECQVDGHLMHAASGQCFEKVYIGYCPDLMLDFIHSSKTVDCLLVDVRHVIGPPISNPCRSGQRLTHEKQCKTGKSIASVMTLPSTRSTGCPPGFVKDHKGTCRSANPFFSNMQ